jgi:hypothetical protein
MMLTANAIVIARVLSTVLDTAGLTRPSCER